MNIRSLFSATAKIVTQLAGAVTYPATTVATTIFSREILSKLENDPSQQAEELKQIFSTLSSTVGGLINISTLFEIISILLMTPAWKNMSDSRRAVFCATLLFSVTQMGLSLSFFGEIDKTFKVGMVLAGSSIFSQAAKVTLIGSDLCERNREQDENDTLPLLQRN